jgi:hypothetical protein
MKSASLKCRANRKYAFSSDIAHEEVCMLLSMHNVNFSW